MLQILSQSGKNSILKVSGSALIVSEGRVDALSLHSIHRNQFRFALGAGSFSDMNSIGETLVIESKPFVSWMKEGKITTDTQPDFTSPFLIGVDSHQSVGAFATYTASTPVSIHSLYDKLSRQFPMGFAIVGYALSSEFSSTYLKKPPIFQENINTPNSPYWASNGTRKEEEICFFGLVLPPEARKKYAKELLGRIFYQNPREEESASFQSHTHAAIIEAGSFVTPTEMHTFLESLKEASIREVRHLLTPTMIQEGTFALFPFDDIQVLEKPVSGPKKGRETLRFPYSVPF